jgi:hypothetical protein
MAILSANALCTLDQVQEYFLMNVDSSIPTSSFISDLLTDLINRKTDQFEKYCGITSFKASTLTEYYDGNGSIYLYPKHTPINSVTSIHDDYDWIWGAGSIIDAVDYRIIGGKYIVCKAGFSEGNQNIKIVYSGGYTSIPGDLVQSCIEEVAVSYNKRHMIGVLQQSMNMTGSVSYQEAGLMQSTKEVLNRYKTVGVI